MIELILFLIFLSTAASAVALFGIVRLLIKVINALTQQSGRKDEEG